MKLEYNGGEGYGYSREDDFYKVKAESGNKLFTKLSEARKHFDTLNEEKALWNVKTCELWESWTATEY